MENCGSTRLARLHILADVISHKIKINTHSHSSYHSLARRDCVTGEMIAFGFRQRGSRQSRVQHVSITNHESRVAQPYVLD